MEDKNNNKDKTTAATTTTTTTTAATKTTTTTTTTYITFLVTQSMIIIRLKQTSEIEMEELFVKLFLDFSLIGNTFCKQNHRS
jgi:hypothetical protein